jgi:hypothetical protein
MNLLPATLDDLLEGASGSERRPDLEWSIAEYLCHVADNLRIWAERLVGARLGSTNLIGSYDQDELARARNYSAIPLAAALWNLRLGEAVWASEVNQALIDSSTLAHPEMGTLDASDVVAMTAHDSLHHLEDIRTILAHSRS